MQKNLKSLGCKVDDDDDDENYKPCEKFSSALLKEFKGLVGD